MPNQDSFWWKYHFQNLSASTSFASISLSFWAWFLGQGWHFTSLTVPRFAITITWYRGHLPWREFTHGLLTTAKCPFKVRVRPYQEHGNGMGRGGGHGTGPWRLLGGWQVRVQGEPTGWGRAGRPRKYSPVSMEGLSTSTVVRGKGKGRRRRCPPVDLEVFNAFSPYLQKAS